MAFLRHRLTARRGGHGVHSPFVYSLCENVFYSRERFYHFEKLALMRNELSRDARTVDAGSFGAGSRTFGSQVRRISAIAGHGITPQRQSELLYRLANFLGIRTSIELGTSLGVNTLYLSLQNPSGKVITVEGSLALTGLAQSIAERFGATNIEFVTARFSEVLPLIVARASPPVLVYIDGDHTYEATMRLFEMLAPLAKPGNVFVFDDIYWSRGMTRAWREISADTRVRLSIDTFYCGYAFFNGEFREKVACSLRI